MKKDVIVSYLTNICKFSIILTSKNYTTIKTKNGKLFFVFSDGRLKYGYTAKNSKKWDVYSVKKMEKILKEKGY